MFYIPQIQNDDCGFACLKMVLASINKDKNYLFLPQEESHGYYSYTDLVDIASKHGLTLNAIRANEKSELINCPSFPFIVTIVLKNGANHAVMVTKANKKKVTYIDPKKGKVSMKLEKFLNTWDGTGLLIKEYEKRKCEEDEIDNIGLGSKVFLGIMELISMTLAAIGVYFIKDDTSIYIPIIFLSLAIIGELLMRFFSYRAMKKLDEYYFSEDIIPSSNYKEYIKRYENFKKLSLTSPMNYILILFFTLALLTVILLNDVKNIMLIVTPIVLAFFDVLVIVPLQRRKKQEISELEEELDQSEDSLDLRLRVKNVHNKAYNYGYVDIAIRYIYASVIILATLVTMNICQISSFPFVIFYSFISLTLYKSISLLFQYGDKIEEYRLAKIKLINFLKK